MRTIISFLLLLPLMALAQQEERDIRDVLQSQVECWHEGDIDCFMQGYWRSGQLVFIGKSGVTYGWDETLANYKKKYPDRSSMGKLSFDIKIIEPLSEDFWFVVGKWMLTRENDKPAGHFSLIFREIGEEWFIVSDHSS